MRRLLPLLLLSLMGGFVHAAPPDGLVAALEKVSEGNGRWAYTETRIRYDTDGSVKDETVVRIDPSQPYAQQSVPLKIKNKPPSKSDLKKYRERGEKKADALARAERLGTPPPKKKSFGDRLDLGRARLVSETETTATYEIPLREPPDKAVPADKLEVHLRINKVAQTVENVSVKLVGSVRIKAVAKVKDGVINVDFTPVHSEFPPVWTRMEGHARASLLLIPIKVNMVTTRTDFRRVKPYDERFGVQQGEPEVLDL